MSKAPGLDWDAIREKHLQRLAEERERGLHDFDPTQVTPPASRGVSPTEPEGSGVTRSYARTPRSAESVRGSSEHRQVVDMKRLLALYVGEGRSVNQTALAMGLDHTTVLRRVVNAGVYRGPAPAGRPRQTHCKRGHDLEEHGRVRASGGRACMECKRIRERKGGEDA